MAAIPTVRRQRQMEALELADDLAHEMDVVLDGSSPATQIFQAQLLNKINTLKHRFSVYLLLSKAIPLPELRHKAHTLQMRYLLLPKAMPLPELRHKVLPLYQTFLYKVLLLLKTMILRPKLRGAAQIDKVRECLSDLLHNANEPPLTKEEFLDNILNPVQGERIVRENAAIARLIRGYGHEQCQCSWREYLWGDLGANDTLSIADKVAGIDRRANMQPADRLQANHRALKMYMEATRASLLADYMIHHISVASFGLDWKELKGRGSKKAKVQFYEHIFQNLDENSDFFCSLDAQERQHAMNTSHKDLYKEWRVLQPVVGLCHSRILDHI
ncbi:hypothetical protein B0H19DRAFT_1266204 [Mycena capillaripes]|nr:hypothetical protein B0H19DRAFT_1266204 [Mycena capillaripes]